MGDLSTQIRTYFDAVADPHRAEAIETTPHPNGRRADRAQNEGDNMSIDLEPKHDIDGRATPGRSRRSVAVAFVSAAALVVAVIALVVAIQRDTAEQVRTDQPEPVAPSEVEPRPTDASSETEGIVGDVEIGEALVDGLDAGDAAAVVALFHDDAIVELNTARSVDEIPRVMDYWALEDAGFTVESCASGRSYSISCAVGFTNAWITEADEPVVIELQIQVDDGRITQIGVSGGNYGAAAIEPYWDFLGEQHPDELATLIADDPDSPAPLGPSLTDESLALHERYIAEFVAQRTAG